MRIWLDADATPRDVKDIVFRAAHRLAIETVVVANQRVPIPLGAPTISAVRVEGERRGLYGGAVGYLDFAGNLDFCIAIRTITMREGRAQLQVEMANWRRYAAAVATALDAPAPE